MVDTHRATRQLERMFGYSGSDSLRVTPKEINSIHCNPNPTIREIFETDDYVSDGSARLIAEITYDMKNEETTITNVRNEATNLINRLYAVIENISSEKYQK